MREPTTSTLSSSASVSPAFPLTGRPSGGSFLFALTIFFSAFLLFQVQPLVAKEILPWFGGSAAVWTTCMLFFQLVLLLGYAYSHLLSSRLTSPTASRVHIGLLFASLLTLPIIPSSGWKPVDGSLPLARILGLLTVTVGVPYFLLASTSPLLQSWYSRSRQGGVPYRFFALSNLGSMLALISYPMVVEPRIPLRLQGWLWSGGYVLFAVLCLLLAHASRLAPAKSTTALDDAVPPRASTRLAWLLLSASASALLLAVTTHITQNVAAIPFLWVLPLSLYLLSFILTFESSRWYSRRIFLGLFAVAVSSMGIAVAGNTNFREIRVLVPLFALGLFVCCMVCHGELARRKPPPRFLTSFYLMSAAGGALGGLFVAAAAPAIFPALLEFPLLLVFTAALVLVVIFPDRPPRNELRRELERSQFWTTWFGSWAALLALAVYLVHGEYAYLGGARLLARNFYGALRVTDDGEYDVRILSHGTINHGEQYLDPVRRRQPISYYSPKTGIGMLMAAVRKRGPMRLGVIGLGSGTMAAFGCSGDFIEFYEINPLVLQIARSQFTYLTDSAAQVSITLGDARLSLEREPPRRFDVMVVDAFSGDSIPVHLLTREAFQIYRRHLQPGGILAVHVSNRYLNLGPEVALLAREAGRESHLIENEKDEADQTFASDWVLTGGATLDRESWLSDEESEIDVIPGLHPWTDDFSNLWQIVK